MAKLENIEPDNSSRPSHGEQPQQFPVQQPSWQSTYQSQGTAHPSPNPGVVQLPFLAVQAEPQMDGNGIASYPVSMDYSGSQASRNLAVGTPWSSSLFDCQLDPHTGNSLIELSHRSRITEPITRLQILLLPLAVTQPVIIVAAIVTALFPCITFGQIAEVLDSGDTGCPLAGYIYLAMMLVVCSHGLIGSKYRRKLRNRYNLAEAPYPDIVSHIFCPCCALAQEFRELHTRGLDPSLGWNGILSQAQHTGNPPPRQSMTRSL